MARKDIARRCAAIGARVEHRRSRLNPKAPRAAPDRLRHRRELRRRAAARALGQKQDLPADRHHDQHRHRPARPPGMIAERPRRADRQRDHRGQRIMIEPRSKRDQPDHRRRRPAEQEPLDRGPVRGPVSDDRQRDQRRQDRGGTDEIARLFDGTVGMAQEDRAEIGEGERVELPDPRIACGGGKRRRQRHDRQQRAIAQHRQDPPVDAPPLRHRPQPEIRAFEHHRIFHLQRQPDQQHRGHHPPRARAVPARRQRRGGDHRQVEEHRCLSALSLRQIEPQDIGDPAQYRAARPARAPRQPDDQRGGGDDAGQRHRLIGDDAPWPGQCGGGHIQQEQADGLAVPDVDIGHRPAPHRVRGAEIEFLVGMQDRIAERHRPRRQRDEEQQREHAPPCGRCRIGEGRRSGAGHAS